MEKNAIVNLADHRTRFFVFSVLLLSGCLTKREMRPAATHGSLSGIVTDSLNLYDSTRNRIIPVALYLPGPGKKISRQRPVIFSHGYGGNEGGANKAYTYLTENLAAHGYFVASIQHELPTDSLMPTSGNPRVVRRSNWERGAKNILFVINELKKKYPNLDYKHTTLIGHSNGGDMTMLFGQKYPELADKVISLDSKRMPFPRTNKPQVYSLRADDDPADPGVLPSAEEIKKYHITIVYLQGIKHGEMSDGANAEQRRVLNDHILSFLRE